MVVVVSDPGGFVQFYLCKCCAFTAYNTSACKCCAFMAYNTSACKCCAFMAYNTSACTYFPSPTSCAKL
jgi:hypothetical protein